MHELKLSLIVTIILSFGLASQASYSVKPIHGKVIYGDDNRKDVYQVMDSSLREVADSTVAMISNYNLKIKSASNEILIELSPYGTNYGLCKDEPFYNQSTAAMCSGFLVGDDLIATAGHCISNEECGNNSFVFGFKTDSQGTTPESVSQDEVYKCKTVLARELTSAQDYALVKLDRPVRGHRVLSLKTTEAKIGDGIFVVGHPTGLPTKITDSAVVRGVNSGFFVTNLDTYGGNSGSAVFDQDTKEVVGILVRGEADYSYDSEVQCLRSNICPAEGCRGEDVTQINYINMALKKLGL